MKRPQKPSILGSALKGKTKTQVLQYMDYGSYH